MINPAVRFISKHLSKSIKKYTFTRVSYNLSIAAYVLATFAICMVTTVLFSLQQFQKQRLLGFSPHVVVSVAKPLANISTGINQANLNQLITSLINQPQVSSQIQAVRLYAGGEFYLQHRNTLLSGHVVGISPQQGNYLFTNKDLASTNPTSTSTNSKSSSGQHISNKNSSSNSTNTANLTTSNTISNLSHNLFAQEQTIISKSTNSNNSNLDSSPIISVDQDSTTNQQTTTNSKTSNQSNISHPTILSVPAELSKFNLSHGSYNLVVPYATLIQNKLKIGDKVSLINSDKSIYYPSGPVPISREFTIVGSYQTRNFNNVWYTNIDDISRLNLSRNINQVVISLKNPLNIVTFSQNLAQDYHLLSKNDYTLVNNSKSLLSGLVAYPDQNSQQVNTITTVTDWRNDLAIIFKSIQFESKTTNTLTSLLIIIAILSCLITFSFILVEKDRDIAVLNVLGMSPPKINQVFAYIVLGLLIRGNIISIICFMLACLLWPYYSPYLNLYINLSYNYLNLALVYVLSSLVIFIATVITGKFIIKIRPAQVLR